MCFLKCTGMANSQSCAMALGISWCSHEGRTFTILIKLLNKYYCRIFSLTGNLEICIGLVTFKKSSTKVHVV